MENQKNKYNLSLTRAFSSPPPVVFKAWTDPEEVKAWFGPEGFTNEIHEWDLRIGGGYRLTMTGPKGEKHTVSGKFLAIEEPSRLSYSWRWEGSDHESVVKVEFLKKDSATEMKFTHESLPSDQSVKNHEQGWTSSFVKLANKIR